MVSVVKKKKRNEHHRNIKLWNITIRKIKWSRAFILFYNNSTTYFILLYIRAYFINLKITLKIKTDMLLIVVVGWYVYLVNLLALLWLHNSFNKWGLYSSTKFLLYFMVNIRPHCHIFSWKLYIFVYMAYKFTQHIYCRFEK